MRQEVGPTQLLVLQGTPFCNINCRYCYLPNRSDQRRMGIDTIETVARNLTADNLWSERTTVVWHSGEPLVLPIAFYEEAAAALERHRPGDCIISQTFQTNGTLVDSSWCDFFLKSGARVGVSLDGPPHIHDAARHTRSGRGTFAAAFRGLQQLQASKVPYYVLSVLTRQSLDAPDDMFAFFVDNGVQELGFNIEEIEGSNRTSSLQASDAQLAFRKFMARFYDLSRGSLLRVREFRSTEAALLHADLDEPPNTQQLTPYRVISVDVAGNFSTFSPELLGMSGPPLGHFLLGNVFSVSFRDALNHKTYQAIARELLAGVEMCQRTCEFFQLCGGGSPSNKLSENGTLASTETMYCRLRVKELSTLILERMEAHFAAAP